MQSELVGVCGIEGDLTRSIYRSLQLIGDPEEILPERGDVILIKPNIGWNKTWDTGTTTSPHFIEALIDILEERRPGKIIVGESPSIGMNGEEVFRETGFDLLRERGVEVKDLGGEDTCRFSLPEGSLLKHVDLPQTFQAADYFVNVPVIKTHVNTCVTISCKNLKGLLPSREKRRFHFIGLDRCIAELVSVVASDLVVVDGEVGQEGLGPISGSPVKVGAILTGTNPIAVDATCITAMGIGLSGVKHLKVALEMGLCPQRENIKVVGDPPSEFFRPFKRPPENLSGSYEGVDIFEGNACSGCIGALTVSLKRMAEAGELRKMRDVLGSIKIVLGPDADVPEERSDDLIVMGKCLRDFSERGRYVPGCSPQGWYIRDVIRGLIGLSPLFVDKDDVMIREGE